METYTSNWYFGDKVKTFYAGNKIYISDNIDKHVSKNKFVSEIRQCCFSIFKLLKLPYFTNYTVKAMILYSINVYGE